MAEKKKKSFLRKLLLPAVIILLVLVFLRIYIPIYIEYNLCDRLREQLKVGEVSCKVRSFGFNHLDLTNIMVGEVKAPFLRADYVRIDYPFLGAFGCAISVSGLTLNLEYNEGKFSIPGVKLEDLMAGNKEGSRSSSNGIPEFIKYLSVSNSCVNVYSSDSRYMIPFDLDAVAGDKKDNDYRLWLNLYPLGESLGVHCVLDPRLRKISTELGTEKMNLARFQDITDSVKGLKVSAMASMSSKLDLPDLNADMKLTLSNLDFQYKSVRITNSTDAKGKPVPFVLQIGRRGASVPFTFNSFRMQAPFPVDFSMDEPGGELKITDSGITVATEIKVKIDSDQFNSKFKSGGFKLKESESMTLLFDAGVRKSMDWNFNFSALHDRNEVVELEGTGQTLSCKPEMISVSGEGDSHSASLNYVVKMKEMEWAKKDGAPISLPSLEFSGNFKADTLAQPLLSGTARMVLDNLSAGPAKCEKMEIVIPYQYPISGGPAETGGESMLGKGNVKTSLVTVGDSKLGSFDAEIVQSGDVSWKVNGRFNTVFEDLKAGVTGELGMRELKGFFFGFDFDVKGPEGGLVVDFGKMNPAYSGIAAEGVLKAKGMAAFEAGTMRTSAEIKLAGGKVDAPSKKLKAEGLELSLSLQDLVALKSLPKQRLKFSKMALGSFQLESGRIDFQLEGPKKYFVEKGGFSWCGGHVNLNAMRIIPGENMAFTLYCDRLNLAAFLQQMKIAEAAGDGTVNGRIPMVIGGKGRSLKIRDGFLYSTPGVGGVISFSKSDMLQMAMTAQGGVSITNFLMDVLKNFKYDWTKISLNSDAGDLKMLLQLSGLPADMFAYNASEGTFTKIEKDEGDIVRFQGMQYDINFNIPFNTLMEMEGDFSALLEELEEGVK